MASPLKVCGGIVTAIGVFLLFTLPPTTEDVGDSLRRSIPYNVAPQDVIEKESPIFRKMQAEYDDAMSRLVSARYTETLIISGLVIIIGLLIYRLGKEKNRTSGNEK